jgi:8-oxo-dGTP pyrophosphatase MutT (NUDIX family)
MSTTPRSFRTIPGFDPRQVPVQWRGVDLPAVPHARLEADALRARFANPPPWSPEGLGDRGWVLDAPPRDAAVLVPIIHHRGGPTVILTERTAHLTKHAGEIAFPGGRRDPEDASPVETALREAREEVGLDPAVIEVVGTLPQYLTGTGYQVTPVIGLVPVDFALQIEAGEVAHAFEVPLAFLMDPANHERRRVVHEDIDRDFHAMPWRCPDTGREHFIWGATAAMIRNLYLLLAA